MTNTEKRLEEFEETKAYQYLKVAGFSLEVKSFLAESITQAIAEERERVRGEINILELKPGDYVVFNGGLQVKNNSTTNVLTVELPKEYKIEPLPENNKDI
ncbi:MAG: hypothetical protein SGJ02_09570 [bacterium]|nr:hypothetical protein [bacterium]